MNAIGAIEAMKELGIRVPQDIAVVGYDDIDIDYFFNVITSYSIHYTKLYEADLLSLVYRRLVLCRYSHGYS